jgi:hypothetical protein
MLMIDSGHEKKPLGIFLVTRLTFPGVVTATTAANEMPPGPMVNPVISDSRALPAAAPSGF